MLFLQFLPVGEHQNLSPGLPNHLGEKVALPCPAWRHHQRAAEALLKGFHRAPVELQLVVPEHHLPFTFM
jgi:hypothetical protein